MAAPQRALGTRAPLALPQAPNQRWSLDFRRRSAQRQPPVPYLDGVDDFTANAWRSASRPLRSPVCVLDANSISLIMAQRGRPSSMVTVHTDAGEHHSANHRFRVKQRRLREVNNEAISLAFRSTATVLAGTIALVSFDHARDMLAIWKGRLQYRQTTRRHGNVATITLPTQRSHEATGRVA